MGVLSNGVLPCPEPDEFRVVRGSDAVVRVRSVSGPYCVVRLVGHPWSVWILGAGDLLHPSKEREWAALRTWERGWGGRG